MRYFYLIITVFYILALNACSTLPSDYSNVRLNFEHIDSLDLSVSKIEIVNNYVPKLSRPNVEHLFDVTPSEVITDFVKKKFVANGGKNNLQIIIEKASVIEDIKEANRNLKNNILFKEKLINYKCEFQLRVKLKSDIGFTKSYILIKTNINKILKSNISLNERGKIFFEINENMILNLDQEINRQAKKHFYNYIV